MLLGVRHFTWFDWFFVENESWGVTMHLGDDNDPCTLASLIRKLWLWFKKKKRKDHYLFTMKFFFYSQISKKFQIDFGVSRNSPPPPLSLSLSAPKLLSVWQILQQITQKRNLELIDVFSLKRDVCQNASPTALTRREATPLDLVPVAACSLDTQAEMRLESRDYLNFTTTFRNIDMPYGTTRRQRQRADFFQQLFVFFLFLFKVFSHEWY